MKKIAVSTVKAYMKSLGLEDTFEVPIGDQGFVLTFKNKLTLEEKNTFIQRVMSGCFDIFGEYHPEGYQPMFNATMLQLCSNAPALSKPKSKKDNGEDEGDPLLDIDAMNDFYQAIEGCVMEAGGKRFQDFVFEMDALCCQRLEWLNEHQKYRDLKPIAELCEEMQNIVRVAGALFSNLEEVVENTDTKELVEYARAVTGGLETLDGENLVKNMFKVYEGEKAEKALEDDAE